MRLFWLHDAAAKFKYNVKQCETRILRTKSIASNPLEMVIIHQGSPPESKKVSVARHILIEPISAHYGLTRYGAFALLFP